MEGTNKGYFAFGSIHIDLHPCIFLNEILLTLEQTKKQKKMSEFVHDGTECMIMSGDNCI